MKTDEVVEMSEIHLNRKHTIGLKKAKVARSNARLQRVTLRV